jgi:hypothetical protein
VEATQRKLKAAQRLEVEVNQFRDPDHASAQKPLIIGLALSLHPSKSVRQDE